MPAATPPEASYVLCPLRAHGRLRKQDSEMDFGTGTCVAQGSTQSDSQGCSTLLTF